VAAQVPAAGSTAPASHIAYLDESGDEGQGRGTRWFVLAAVVCALADAPTLESTLTKLKVDVGGNAKSILHFRQMNHTNRKHVATGLGSLDCVKVIAVVSDTSKIPPPGATWSEVRPRNWLYHYMTRYAIERIVRAVRSVGGTGVEVVMSNKTTLTYDHLRAYLKRLQKDDDSLKLVTELKPRLPTQSDGLQLADIAASSTFFAFEPDRFGSREEAYVRAIAPRLWRSGSTLIGAGLKFMGTSAVQTAYVDGECAWVKTL
jgi:hypothetical protein